MSDRSTEVHSIVLGLGLGHEWKFSCDRSVGNATPAAAHLQHTCSSTAGRRCARAHTQRAWPEMLTSGICAVQVRLGSGLGRSDATGVQRERSAGCAGTARSAAN